MPRVTVEGCALHYEDDDFSDPWTPSETVFVHHAFGRNSSLWYQWVPLLASQFRVIRLDMRGHGRSAAPATAHVWSVDGLIGDIVAVLDAVDTGPVHYLGEALGGMLGISLAARAPERFRSLTVTSCGAAVPQHETEAAFAVDGQGWGDAMEVLGVGGWARQHMVPGGFAGSDGSPERRRWLVDQWQRTPVEVAQSLHATVGGYDVSELLSQVTVPTLVIAAARSHFWDLAAQAQVFEAIPGAQLAVVDGPGAEVCFDNAPDAARAFLAFVASLPPAPKITGENDGERSWTS